MSGPSLVTLVTPTYNQAGYLPETLDSVLAQTHPALEYLVIDDGSSDDTQAVMARYAGRLTALRQDNIGQARTLNKGWVDRFTGEHASFDRQIALFRVSGHANAAMDL